MSTITSSTNAPTLALIGSVYLGAWPGKKACKKTMRKMRTRLGMMLEADATIFFLDQSHTLETAVTALKRLDRQCAACAKCKLGKPP